MKSKPKFFYLFGFLPFSLLPAHALAASLTQQYEQLYNPLPANEIFCPTAACDLVSMLLLILRNILQLIPIASVLFIVIGGFQMAASQGNQEKLLKAKRTIYWAIAGLVIALLSFSLIAIEKTLIGFSQ